MRIEGTVVYTNNPPCGAMRGFGAPQVCFAYESAMDELAARLGIDPVELRLRNALQTGSVLPTGQVVTGSAPAREVLERCAAIPLPPEEPAAGRDPLALPGRRRQREPRRVAAPRGRLRPRLQERRVQRGLRRRGRGDGHARRPAASRPCVPRPSTTARASTPCSRRSCAPSSTSTRSSSSRASTVSGSAGSTSASRQTTMSGGAVLGACRELRAALDEGAELPLSRTFTYHHRPTTGFDEDGQGDIHVTLSFAAERAVVEVDEELGLVRVVQIAAVQDAGRVINPDGAEGQVEGGTAIGLGLGADGERAARRRRDPERVLHRLPDPDRPRRAPDRDRVRRGARARRALRREGHRRGGDGRRDAGDRGGAARGDRPHAERRPRRRPTTWSACGRRAQPAAGHLFRRSRRSKRFPSTSVSGSDSRN